MVFSKGIRHYGRSADRGRHHRQYRREHAPCAAGQSGRLESVFYSRGVLTAAIAIFFHVVVRDRPYPNQGLSGEVTGASRRTGVIVELKTLFFNRDYWLISCGTFFRYGTLMAIQGLWAGPYLMQCFMLSPVQAGNIITGTIIGYVAGSSGGGWLSDRVLGSRKYVVILGMTGLVATTMCLTWSLGQKTPFFRRSPFSRWVFSPGSATLFMHT